MRRLLPVALVVALFAAGCSSGSGSSSTAAGNSTTLAATVTTAATTTTAAADALFAARPYEVIVPKSYDASVATPLVLLLHGYGATGAIQNAYFGLEPLAQSRGFLYVHPDGTKNRLGKQFWNATDACCAGPTATVDDSAYLVAMIDAVEAKYNVDPKRVFLIGHSNGGFMSYRMACDHADRIAAIASMAGATFADRTKCTPSEPVSVLQVHGTADRTIAYAGGANGGAKYPGAVATAATWAAYNGCRRGPDVQPPKVDLITNEPGAETTRTAYRDCARGAGVELWTVAGGPHIPAIGPAMLPAMLDFLFAHPKA